MTRVVESVASDFGDSLSVEIVYTKELDGALQYVDISKKIGRPVPVPSIIINGKLAFDLTPSVEVLTSYLRELNK